MGSAMLMPFRELVTFARGGGWGSDHEEVDHAAVRVIRGTDFSRIREGSFANIPRRWERTSKITSRRLHCDDVILEMAGGSKTSGQTTGRSLYIDDRLLANFKEEIVIPASFCRLLRFDKERVFPLYAYYGLQDMYTSGRAGGYEHQSTGLSNFQFEYFLDSELLRLPPLSEQRAIAEVLGALDDKIEANRRIIELCDFLASALLRNSKRESRRIVDVIEVLMGQSPPGETYNDRQDGLPFFQGTRDFGFRFPTRRVWCSAPTRVAEKGDVLVSVRAPVGRLNVARECCAIGRGLAALRSSRPSTAFHALAADGARWEPFENEGTVFGAIGKEQLSGVRVEWPCPDGAAAVEERLGVIDARLAAAEEETVVVATLRDTLLPKLLTGELRVRDAEELVGEAV